MADSRALEIIQRQGQLASDRATWESHWREIAERVLPRQDDFQTKRTEGMKHTEKIFDATAPLALERAAAAIDSLITPETQQWHGLEPEDPNLLEDPDVMEYLDQVVKMMFRLRYRPGANFASQAHECYMSLMAFGTQGMFTDDVLGIGTRYKSIALAELYIAENHAGIVDYVHRKFEMTSRQAFQKWGEALPEKIKTYKDKEPFRKWEFIHCVKPNEEYKAGRQDWTGMAFSSQYVSIEGTMLMQQGGYRTMPYAVSRHVTAPKETYGRSPAMTVLADIKMVNEMEKTTLRAAHKIVDPPLLVYGDGALNAFSARPNAINYGGVDDQGRPLVHPLKTGANLPIVLEMSEAKRKLINDAFYVTLFQILVENPRMTATEALIRAQEKGQLLAPTVGRQQSEFLGPIIERELDILAAAGALPPMPPQLKRRGGLVKAVYNSPLSRLRRAEDGVAISRTIEMLTPIAQIKPQVWDIFDEALLAREIADINGTPVRVLRRKEDYDAMQQQREQQAQELDVAKTAQAAGNAAKNLGAAAQSVGTVVPLTNQP